MNKTVVIGIDSLDPHLVRQYERYLPNFESMMMRGLQVKMKSIFPPDTIPAWASIFLGKNPAKHGLLYTTDIFGTNKQEILDVDMGTFRGKTFWDHASTNGKKVCVLFPNLVYPPWPVNGVMVCRSTTETRTKSMPEWLSSRRIMTYPQDSRVQLDIPDQIECVTGYPPAPKDFTRYVDKARETTKLEAEIGMKVAEEIDFDLFFIFFSWLDVVQHLFWRYSDTNDPTFPGENEHQNIIRDFYVLVDHVVEGFVRKHADDTVLILSDHGHGMRPTKVVNVNEMLRKKGYLTAKKKLLPIGLEKAKKIGLRFAAKHDLMRMLVMASKDFSISKSIYMSTSAIDRKKSLAYLSAFVGSKSYPQGGVVLNTEMIEKGKVDYAEIMGRVIHDLEDLRKPGTDETLVKWARRREDVYDGPFIGRFPEILFELKDGYGVYWAIREGIVGIAYEHSVSSGGHTEDAMLIVLNPKRKVTRLDATLMDIAPTILDNLDIECKDSFDGDSLYRQIGKVPNCEKEDKTQESRQFRPQT